METTLHIITTQKEVFIHNFLQQYIQVLVTISNGNLSNFVQAWESLLSSHSRRVY